MPATLEDLLLAAEPYNSGALAYVMRGLLVFDALRDRADGLVRVELAASGLPLALDVVDTATARLSDRADDEGLVRIDLVERRIEGRLPRAALIAAQNRRSLPLGERAGQEVVFALDERWLLDLRPMPGEWTTPETAGCDLWPSLQERYTVGGLVGLGSTASVYRAFDRWRGVDVAIKLYDQRVQRNVDFVAAFRRSVRAARALDHPHVLPPLSYGYADDGYYVVSAYIGGGSLADDIPAHAGDVSPRLLSMLRQVCAGLDYIHQAGLVHGNLKPSNILLREDSTALIADVRPLHQAASSDLTMTDALLATVTYCSPEQIMEGEMDPRSDIYALGALLYHLCTGRPPFAAPNPLAVAFQHLHAMPQPPRALNPRLHPSMERIILRCLEKEPARRYATVRDLDAALAAPELSSMGVSAEPAPRAALGGLRRRALGSLLRRRPGPSQSPSWGVAPPTDQ